MFQDYVSSLFVNDKGGEMLSVIMFVTLCYVKNSVMCYVINLCCDMCICVSVIVYLCVSLCIIVYLCVSLCINVYLCVSLCIVYLCIN